jgi:hypothetical protein
VARDQLVEGHVPPLLSEPGVHRARHVGIHDHAQAAHVGEEEEPQVGPVEEEVDRLAREPLRRQRAAVRRLRTLVVEDS